MLQINRENAAYRIRLSGDRRRFVAESGDELMMAVRHYWALPGHDPERCPLCRTVKALAKPGSRLKPNLAVARIRRKK